MRASGAGADSAGRLYYLTNHRLPNQGRDMAQMQNGSHLEVSNTVGFMTLPKIRLNLGKTSLPTVP